MEQEEARVSSPIIAHITLPPSLGPISVAPSLSEASGGARQTYTAISPRSGNTCCRPMMALQWVSFNYHVNNLYSLPEAGPQGREKASEAQGREISGGATV